MSRLSKRQKQMIEAMERNVGNVSAACAACNDLSRTTHYDWMKKNEKYRQAIDDVEQKNIDFAESMLMVNIKAKKEKSIFYYLDRRGKDRGYGKSMEVTGKDGAPLHPSDITRKNLEQAEKDLDEHFGD